MSDDLQKKAEALMKGDRREWPSPRYWNRVMSGPEAVFVATASPEAVTSLIAERDIAKGFHDVAVQQRDAAWAENDRLREALRRVSEAEEAARYLSEVAAHVKGLENAGNIARAALAGGGTDGDR